MNGDEDPRELWAGTRRLYVVARLAAASSRNGACSVVGEDRKYDCSFLTSLEAERRRIGGHMVEEAIGVESLLIHRTTIESFLGC